MTIDLVLRGTKNAPVTWDEVDNNFDNLANALIALDLIKNPQPALNYGKGFFYRGDTGGPNSSNILTIFNGSYDLLQPETNIGSLSLWSAGANIGLTKILYYGGWDISNNLCTLIDNSGNLIGSEIAISSDIAGDVSGATLLANALMRTTDSGNTVLRLIDSNLTLVQTDIVSNEGTNNAVQNGATFETEALFFGGYSSTSLAYLYSANCTLLNQSTTTSSGARDITGAHSGTNVLYHGGRDTNYNYTNNTFIVTPTLVLAQDETHIGAADMGRGAASIGSNVLFYGGVFQPRVTILTPTATLVSTETTIGTGRSGPTGASI